MHSDIVPLIMKYHELTLKSLNKLKLFKKLFYKETKKFSKKNKSRKRNIDLILPDIFPITPVDGSCYSVIHSAILQEFFHHFPQSFHRAMKIRVRVKH